ncbi:hypothetical protein [Tsukamurella pulmonis]|uniref:hypothetical protein n=1 Tax=Tsukamurella pulmonis TaxID=47312 RepID=UPI000A407E1C|nr:hypothetical protein [Tsukamurella pulmonis]
MATDITFEGATTSTTTTVTLPAHQAGDLIVIAAMRSSATAASVPAGWTDLGSRSQSVLSIRAGYRVATSAAETSGTWTNASRLHARVYRLPGALAASPTAAFNSGTGTATAFADLAVATASRIAFVRAAMASSDSYGTAPTGWDNLESNQYARSLDALNTGTTANGVGGNAFSASNAYWASVTIGFSSDAPTSSGDFFAFF